MILTTRLRIKLRRGRRIYANDMDVENDLRPPCYGTATKLSSSFVLVLVIENENVEGGKREEEQARGARE
jgi:hypothetical protein